MPRAPSAHSIKTSPGLVSRPLLLQVMVRGPTPGGLLFHQEINNVATGRRGLSLWAPMEDFCKWADGQEMLFPTTTNMDVERQGLRGRGSFHVVTKASLGLDSRPRCWRAHPPMLRGTFPCQGLARQVL